MKLLFACSLLTASVLLLEAHPIPSSKQLYKKVLLGAVNETTKLGDIWKDCTKSSDLAQLLNLVIDPNPPVRGKVLKWNLEINLDKEVESGKIEIRLHGDLIPYTQVEDLCQVVEKEGKSCPLEPGKQSIILSTPIPSIAPKGHYVGNGYLKDGSGTEIICIALDFNLE